MPTFEYHGQTVFYTAHADAPAARPPLVLVHGAGGSHLHWPAHLRRLDGAPVYAFDLPGHGHSGGAGYSSIAEYSNLLAAWRQALALPRFVLVGHSMGSAIALSFALNHPDNLTGLVLIGASSRLPVAPAILNGIQQDFDATAELITNLCYGPATSPTKRQKNVEFLRKVGAQVLLGDYLACNDFDVTDRLAELRTPTLIIGALHDKMTPARLSERLQQRIAGSELHLLDCGHMIPIEQPEQTTGLIGDFVARIATH
jgi:pimeloyl-ACP methyl ester carboxylesterase